MPCTCLKLATNDLHHLCFFQRLSLYVWLWECLSRTMLQDDMPLTQGSNQQQACDQPVLAVEVAAAHEASHVQQFGQLVRLSLWQAIRLLLLALHFHGLSEAHTRPSLCRRRGLAAASANMLQEQLVILRVSLLPRGHQHSDVFLFFRMML